jgi:hypothetical protein
LSAYAIAHKLNSRCILSPLQYKKKLNLPHPRNGFAYKDNAKWSASTIFRILKDETYIGALVQGKQYTINYKIKKQFTKPCDDWIRVENAHEAIVSKYDFETVQRILQLDTRASPGMTGVSLFSGILICGCCNGNMTRKTVTCNKKVNRYYYCPTGKKNGCNSPTTIREYVLTAYIFEEIKVYISKINAFTESLRNMGNEEIDHELTKKLRVCMEKEQKNLNQALLFKSNLSSALMSGIINEEDYSYMKANYTNKIASLENTIELTAREIRDVISHRNEQLEWLDSICKFDDRNTFDRALIVRIVQSIHVRAKDDIAIDFVFEM